MDIRLNVRFIYFFVSAFMHLIHEMETEAPTDVVGDELLQHESPSQPLPSPYGLTSNRWKLRPGNLVSVFITSKNETTPFRGFLVTAKDNINFTVGTFIEDENYKLLNLGEGHNNAATHLNDTEKTRMTVYWKAPPILKGPMRFSMTIVQKKGTYWVGEESEEMKVER